MKLDDIEEGEAVVMTKLLVSLFKKAGCHPTICHACKISICVGDKFRLLSHTRKYTDKQITYISQTNISAPDEENIGKFTDEMVCVNCGEDELCKRDSDEFKEFKVSVKKYGSGIVSTQIDEPPKLRAGFSRPSKCK